MTSVTGMRWKRPDEKHPDWCARGHVCDAYTNAGDGQHRSQPLAMNTAYGRLVYQHVQRRTGKQWMQFTALVVLDQDPVIASAEASVLSVAVDETIRMSLARTNQSIADMIANALPPSTAVA